MKRFYVLALAVLLLLSFAGCGDQSSGEFDHIVQLLEQGDYDAAKAAINQLQGDVITEPIIMETQPTEVETVEMPAEELPPETEEETVPAGETRKVLTNMPITWVDNLGNTRDDNYYFYNYDEQGRVIKIGGHENAISYGVYLNTFADYLKVAYTLDGRIADVKVTDSWDNVSALGTPAYDDSGNMVSMHIQTNTEEFTLNFSYDDNGNCLRADIFDSFWSEIAFDIQYTYDAEGRLVKEVWDCVGFGHTSSTIEHTYDENGCLAQSVKTWHEYEEWHETTVYTHDAEGNLIQSVTTSDKKESGYKTKTVDYEYTNITVKP